jgi:hypothetical protein
MQLTHEHEELRRTYRRRFRCWAPREVRTRSVIVYLRG